MTKYWFTDPAADLPQPVFSRESRQRRREALQALSRDAEQLWQKLADRFDSPGASRVSITSRLQQTRETMINVRRGRGGTTDRNDGPAVHNCESVRHA